MPKLKSKSGAKKRFRLTASGKVRRASAFHRHCMSSKTQKQKRNSRKTQILTVADAKIVKQFLPYA